METKQNPKMMMFYRSLRFLVLVRYNIIVLLLVFSDSNFSKQYIPLTKFTFIAYLDVQFGILVHEVSGNPDHNIDGFPDVWMLAIDSGIVRKVPCFN